MSANVQVCELDPGLLQKLRKFRMRKETTNAAIVLKIDTEALQVILDEEYEELTVKESRLLHMCGARIVQEKDISIDDLREELPAHQPRYVLYSYCLHHDDGRVSYPLVFIFVSPQGGNPLVQMMYAGSKLNLVKEAEMTKVFEVRSIEEITEDWLKQKLAFFR